MASKASSKCLTGAKSISSNLTRQASTTATAASRTTTSPRARLRWNLTDSDEATLSKFVRKAEERNKRKASERQKVCLHLLPINPPMILTLQLPDAQRIHNLDPPILPKSQKHNFFSKTDPSDAHNPANQHRQVLQPQLPPLPRRIRTHANSRKHDFAHNPALSGPLTQQPFH